MSEILIGSNPDNPQVVGIVNFEAPADEKAKAQIGRASCRERV